MIEISIMITFGWGEVELRGSMRESSGVLKMFYILMWVVFTQVYSYIKFIELYT